MQQQQQQPVPVLDSAKSPSRLASVDVYRGFVMFLMVAEVLHLSTLAAKFPDNLLWQAVSFHTQHVDWVGCSLHDMIQPSFSFLVGVALPFSLAARQAKGQTKGLMALHALWRSLILILLGVFLRSTHSTMTNWTFEDTLTQIGLGYFFLFLLGWQRTWVVWLAFFAIVGGYWLAWALHPLHPGVGTDFLSHWHKNANFGSDFDKWFLNLFPRKNPFNENSGGYLTLSFIPTLGTMILGLIAGRWLRMPIEYWKQIAMLVIAGVISLAAGYYMHEFNICPNVKRIWTPTWVFYSGGWCFLMLALFVTLVDVLPLKPLFFPFLVIGANSIAIYCLAHLIDDFIKKSLYTHLGKDLFLRYGKDYEQLLIGIGIMLVLWLILFWMYRRKLFIKL